MRSSGAFTFHLGLGAVVFSATGAIAWAQDAPSFRHLPQLRPAPAVPRATWYPPGVEATLPVAPAAEIAPAKAVRREAPYVPYALRRLRQRNFAASSSRDAFTIRAPGGVLAQLSLGSQTEFRATDNVNGAPEETALSEEILDFTPIARLSVGGTPGLQPDRATEPALYLDALYAPTAHHLLRAGASAFLQHLLVQAGRATQVAHIGGRFAYDENSFASSSDSSAEENYNVLETGPVVEYRTSAKTALHFRGDYRRITLDDADSNRTELAGDARIDCELSVKTTAGIGAAAGRITFDREDFGTQDYWQGFVTLIWKATEKLSFRTQAGVELREFARAVPKADSVSPVAVAVLDWRATERTRVAAAFRVQNQPSVEQSGSLFRETKFAVEAQHDISASFYARAELEYARRAYDTDRLETEVTVRPAIGYQLVSGAAFDSVKLEVFYQFRRHWNRGPGGEYDRNQGGVQLTAFF